MIAQPTVDPGRSVAEALAAILPPPPLPLPPIFAAQTLFPPLGRPPEFSSRPRRELLQQHSFPILALPVPQANPHEVKEFMRQDARQLRPIIPQSLIQNQFPPPQEARRMHLSAGALS